MADFQEEPLGSMQEHWEIALDARELAVRLAGAWKRRRQRAALVGPTQRMPKLGLPPLASTPHQNPSNFVGGLLGTSRES